MLSPAFQQSAVIALPLRALTRLCTTGSSSPERKASDAIKKARRPEASASAMTLSVRSPPLCNRTAVLRSSTGLSLSSVAAAAGSASIRLDSSAVSVRPGTL